MMTGIHFRWRILTLLVLMSVSLLVVRFPFGEGKSFISHTPSPAGSARLLDAYGKSPLVFEANTGQADRNIKFLAHGNGYTLFLTTSGPVLAFTGTRSQSVLNLHLAGAQPHPQVVGQDKLPGTTNYFLGNNPSLWHANISTYGRVMYQNVYPGVNLVYYGNQSHLEYDFVINPGANPRIIGLTFAGEQHLQIDGQGNLVLFLADGKVVQPRPYIYQEIAGSKQAVPGRYALLGTNQIGFEVGAYDFTRPLIIDPVLSYSTYLGGSKDDQAYGIAIDGAGNAYVTGYTYSTNFPIKNAFQSNLKGSYTVFVTKLNASGNAAVYSTYLGGSGGDTGYSITVDSTGNAYLTGYTSSTDFPTRNALQSANHGGDDAFVTKLNASGNALVYSTYLGGSQDDYGQGITVDSAGNVYLTGYTSSTDFPIKNALQSINHAGSWTAFVTKLNTSGSALVYSTYLGGSDYDQGNSITVDSAGNVYLTGDTGSRDFPTKNALQKTHLHPGSGTGFISKLNASGSSLVFSTFLGGSSLDIPQAITVDNANNIYVTGWTASKDFPTKNPLQPTNHGHLNAFVSKLVADGSAFVYSTYLGGKGHDIANGIALDSKGNAYLTGYTDSRDFPLVNALQSHKIAFADVFISELNANGSALNFSTYFGGSSYDDQGNSIAVDSTGNIYVAGYTQSKTFPTKNPFQGTFGGGSYDAFVTKIGP